MRINVKRRIAIVVLLLSSISLAAQNAMRVHYKNGTEQDILLSEIGSVTFLEKAVPNEEVTIVGNWLWGNHETGYYELLTFNDDHTYTGYDNYFSYGFDTMTYGWYSQYGNMLTLQSNGFGYKRIYNWFVLGLSGNALEVMTKMGGFTYYRLRPETLYVSTSGTYSGFATSDRVVFSDGVVVKAEGYRLLGLVPGTTYVLVHIASADKIVAYKVVVN